MKKDSLLNEYLINYSVGEKWKLIANESDDIFQAVVIPAYAEKEMLFFTLASLAKNPPSSLKNTLVICVVNNKEHSPAPDIENNVKTMEILDALVKKKSLKMFKPEKGIYPLLNMVSDSSMNLGYINASSKGLEMPRDTGGVGMARKIGMDKALRLLKKNNKPNNVIISLDADTLVQNNYLPVIKHFFSPLVKTAIVAYEHQMPEQENEQAAICCYEIFLRYWVLGLKYAKSPWAFHSIGSTISVSADAYLEVRGMNRQRAGEDFYFLNKLAKVGKIVYTKETCVYPSARLSTRVPFGTGKRIERFLSGRCEKEYYLYDPRIFLILSQWLQLVQDMLLGNEHEILKKTETIHPRLKSFLEENKFHLVWPKMRRVAKDEKLMAKQFNDWFDGFKTLKLVHYFTREIYPQINMFRALEQIIDMLNISGLKYPSEEENPPLIEQKAILSYLRGIS